MLICENSLSRKYDKKDAIIAISLSLVILLLSLFSLFPSCAKGDDFAAYILEGISIAKGDLEQQSFLNYCMHKSVLPGETNGQLVYVWGYPLLLALVYKIVGFDTVSFTGVIYYKLPSAICFALFAAILYLLLRRHFKKFSSIFMTAAFCSGELFYEYINSLCSDIVYLCFCTLCILLIEIYFSMRRNEDEHSHGKKNIYL